MDSGLLQQIFLLFGLILIGFVANKTHVLDENANAKFSSFLLKIALPATILNSAFNNSDIDQGVIRSVTVVAVAIFLAMPVVSYLLAKIFKWDRTYQLMLNYSNLGFMDLPIINSIYGEAKLIYVVIFMMVFNIHIFTVGVITLQGKPQNFKEMLKKLCTPGIISAILAFIFMIFPIQIPALLKNLLSTTGSVTTPLAMIVIGSQLAQVDLLKSFQNKQMYVMSAIKLLVYPFVVFFAVKTVTGMDMIAEISAILMGLPVAGNVTMLCSEYGGKTSLAAEGTCISTMLSIATIPIMLSLIS